MIAESLYRDIIGIMGHVGVSYREVPCDSHP